MPVSFRGLSAPKSLEGATLIELVLVIVVAGAIAAMFALFLVNPMRAYQDLSRRAGLVEAAESALRRMARDIRLALPNSIRVTSNPGGVPGFALELIPAVDGGRYCVAGLANCSGANQELAIPGPDADFDILGCFRDSAFLTAAQGGSQAYRLIINNTGNAVYDGSAAVITPPGTTVILSTNPGPGPCPGGGNHHVNLSPAAGFSAGSARQRVFVVPVAQAAITYLCNAANGTLTRFEGYGITDPQPVNPAAAPLAGVPGRRVADSVSACSVTTLTNQVIERGLVTLDLSLSSAGETIRLLAQVQLDNSP